MLQGNGTVVTVTLNVQFERLLTASVTVQVTVVVPMAKLEPDGGEQLAVAPGQLSPNTKP